MKAKIVSSAITGFFFGSMGFFVLLLLNIEHAFPLSIASGLLFALLLFPVMVIYEKILNIRYAKYEKELFSPVFYQSNGNFTLDNKKVRNGNIYFCEAGIVCVFLEEKPYTSVKILLQDIDRIQFDQFTLTIRVKDGRVFTVTLPDTQKVAEIVREKGWT